MTEDVIRLRPWLPAPRNPFAGPPLTEPEAIDPDEALVLDFTPPPHVQALLHLSLGSQQGSKKVYHPLPTLRESGTGTLPPGYGKLLRITGIHVEARFDDGKGIDAADLRPDPAERPFTVPQIVCCLALRDHSWAHMRLTIPCALALAPTTAAGPHDLAHFRPVLSETTPCPGYKDLRDLLWNAFFIHDDRCETETRDSQEERFHREALGWLHHHLPDLQQEDPDFADALSAEITHSLGWLAFAGDRLTATLTRHATLVCIDHA